DDSGIGAHTATRTFTVTVNSVNDQPTLNSITNPGAINEDAGIQTVGLSGITMGAPNEGQTLTVSATSSNTGIIPTPTVVYTSANSTGSLTYTPVANAFGTSLITVVVDDNGGGTSTVTQTFTVTINAVNDAPTLNNLSNAALLTSAP